METLGAVPITDGSLGFAAWKPWAPSQQPLVPKPAQGLPVEEPVKGITKQERTKREARHAKELKQEL